MRPTTKTARTAAEKSSVLHVVNIGISEEFYLGASGENSRGIDTVSRGLAELVGGTGVIVNSVLPGPTRSEILGNWMAATASEQGITQDEAEQNFLKTMRPTTLINRFTTTGEVANMVVYVCSEQASGTSGAALRVDGGVVRSIV
ncbi:MAG TPA: SDR family oxidoreductase [Pararhizobium sp.]|nr:SDR family oxidoreductase [Pararhizobium sp.]HTO30482.1 SDR family oxidoreductase [Pararhizobium sp.]